MTLLVPAPSERSRAARGSRWIALAVALSAVCLAGSSAMAAGLGPAVGPHPGGTLTILANYNISTPDPAINYYGPAPFGGWETEFLTYDGLVAFDHVSGPSGAQVVPDLAASIPTPTNGAKTWKFVIRKGIKFSNGMPLVP